MRAVACVFAGLASLACSVEDVILEGRKCPCPAELECVDGICVSPGAGGSAACTPKVTIADFHVEWQTPNTIRWAWDADGAIDDFAAFELVTAENEVDLANRSGTAVVWTVNENPELGELILPDSQSPTDDEVKNTITDGHAPKRTYFGQLRAIDNAGCAFVTPSVQTVTSDVPIGEIELFSDGPISSTNPPEYGLSSDGAFAGSACLEYTRPECTGMACYENLQLHELMTEVADKMTENQFVTKSYLELSVSISGEAPSYWGQVWLALEDAYDVWSLQAVVMRAGGEYRTYQIPLRVLGQSGMQLDLATLETRGIASFDVGGLFTPGTVVRVDEISLKW